jgi:hypothetical protein
MNQPDSKHFFYIPILFVKKKKYQKIYINNDINNDIKIQNNLKLIKRFNLMINYQNQLFLKFKRLFTKRNNIITNKKDLNLFITYNSNIKKKVNSKNIDSILENYFIKTNSFEGFKLYLNNNLNYYINKKKNQNYKKTNNDYQLIRKIDKFKEYENKIKYYKNILHYINKTHIHSKYCSICLTNINKLIVTVCGHFFCLNCILEWSKYNNKCPECRTIYNINNLYYITNNNDYLNINDYPNNYLISLFGKKITLIINNINNNYKENKKIIVVSNYNNILIIISKILTIFNMSNIIYDNQNFNNFKILLLKNNNINTDIINIANKIIIIDTLK